MLGISKKSSKPTTFYALGFCIDLVAFILMAIGMFTPFWATITEQVGTTTTDVEYDRGLIVSCPATDDCQTNRDFDDASAPFMAAFVLGIMAVISGFFLLQLFGCGMLIKSCRDTNLAIPLVAMSIGQGILLILVLVLFEISLGRDTTAGNIHRNDTFGFSRGLIIGAVIFYWIAAIFIIGEYMRRNNQNGPSRMDEDEEGYKPSRSPQKRHRGQRHKSDRGPKHRESRRGPTGAPAVIGAPGPPPYSRANPVYDREIEDKYYSPLHGMRPCKLPGCHMCSFVAGSPTFWGPAGVFNINERLTCQNGNVVYAIICVMDDKVFIGHSYHKLEDTFRQHLENIKTRNMSDPVAYHFNLPNHSNLDLRVSALARINCDSDTRARLEKALSYDMDRPHNSYYGINDDFEFL